MLTFLVTLQLHVTADHESTATDIGAVAARHLTATFNGPITHVECTGPAVPVRLDLPEVLEALNDQRPITRDMVSDSALNARVWVASWGAPGCLSEAYAVCTSKAFAIDTACAMAEDSDGRAPRGMRTDLRRTGRSTRTPDGAIVRNAVTRVEQVRLRELF